MDNMAVKKLLNWGNVLKFDNAKEYYETLGFLSKDKEHIRVYTESNDKAGAWAGQGRMSLCIADINSLPEALRRAFMTSADGRISETRYVRNLKENMICGFDFREKYGELGKGYIVSVDELKQIVKDNKL